MRRLIELAAVVIATAALLPASATAQVVQLPTFHQFSTNSSVLVPDRGAAYLGGVDSAAYGSSQRGPFNRSIGGAVGRSGLSVHATIIDHTELDRAVLAEAAARRGASVDVLGRDIATGEIRRGHQAAGAHGAGASSISTEEAVRRKAAFLSRHVTRSPPRR
jgi:hypothetical protein